MVQASRITVTYHLASIRQELEAARTTCARETERAEQAENLLGDREFERKELSKVQAHVSQLEELCQLKEKETCQCRNEFDALKGELKVVMSTKATLMESEMTLTAEVKTIRCEREMLGREVEIARTELAVFRKEVEGLQTADCASKELVSLNGNGEKQSIVGELAPMRVDNARLTTPLEAPLTGEVETLHNYIENVRSLEKLNTAKPDQQLLMQTLQPKANKEIKYTIDDKHQALSGTSVYSFNDSQENEEGDKKDIEIANLKDVIEMLKTELKAAPAARKELVLANELSAEEILTFQDEVERLNQEISCIKRNAQTSKMIDSIMAKDEEIRGLRRGIAILRDQLDSTIVSMLTQPQIQVYSKAPDADKRSVIRKFFDQETHRPFAGARSKDTIQLKSINESLRNGLEEVNELKDSRDELESTLNVKREKIREGA